MPRMNAPLSQILGITATKLSIKWKDDARTNSILLYRIVRKTWETPFRTSRSRYKSTLEGKTSASSNSNALTSRSQNMSPAQNKTRDLVELTAMKDNIDSVMTSRANLHQSSRGIATLTDRRYVVEATNGIIINGMRSLSRMVRLRLQTIKVTSKNNGEAGGDVSSAVCKWVYYTRYDPAVDAKTVRKTT